MTRLSFSSLRFLIPTLLFSMVAIMVFASMTHALAEREETFIKVASDDLKRNVAHLARLTEKLMPIDPQLIDDDLTQLRTDPRFDIAAIIDSQGKILSTTEFSLRSKNAIDHLPGFNALLFEKATTVRGITLIQNENGNRIIGIMGFYEPFSEHTLRGNKKGVIFASYDLSNVKSSILTQFVREESIEIIAAIIITLIFTLILDRYIVQPLSRMQSAANDLARGDFHQRLEATGPLEIASVIHDFNQMADNLRNYTQRIKEQRERGQAIIDNVIDGIITIDASGHIESMNKAAERIFGYDENVILGKKINILMPAPYKNEHDQYIANFLSGGEAKVIGRGREVEGLRKNGDIFPMDLAVTEINHQGKRLFVGIVRDITERQKVEKMKNEFISTVSHELRTPLTAINGAVSLAASGSLGELPATVKEMLDTADRNCKRLTNLVNDLLDMEKIIAGKVDFEIQAYKIDELINEAITLNQPYGDEYQVNLLYTTGSSDVKVLTDKTRFYQILSNYLSNACKFSEPGSEIEISVEEKTESCRILIKDHGQGIPDEFKPAIFKKFSQADSSNTRRTGGTGLGLAICKELVEKMNGEVGFESEEGKGSTFYFDIPYAVPTNVPALQDNHRVSSQ